MNNEIPETIPIDGDILARLEEIEGAVTLMQKKKEVDYQYLHDMVDSLSQIIAKFMYEE